VIFVFIKLALKMGMLVLVVVALSQLLLGIYLYVQANIDLLDDEALIAIISRDVLGDSSYGKSCPRTSYMGTVESRPTGDKGSGYFVFKPVEGQEKNCPPIAIITNRRTGEAWIEER